MAMSPEAFQEVETTTCLLSGATSLASRLSRACLAVLFFIRFGILLIGCRTIWQDEEKDFICNSSKLLCKPSCFDEFSPISSFNLFSLQMVALLTHSLCVACFSRSSYQAREGWLHAQLRRKQVQRKLHVIILMSRMFIEGIFIFTFYKVTDGFVHKRTVQCHSTLCESLVTCTDANPTIKSIFSMCLCTASAASAIICLWELVTSLQPMQHVSSSSASPSPCKKQHF
ncbi:gap junction beta-1 protein-like [Pseudophryne corroboree]|uniref:gap junction beta-1 protein-like n=1 Tax=Pseudophryne corroboree TaxID=495146 RepID=UPI0030813789